MECILKVKEYNVKKLCPKGKYLISVLNGSCETNNESETWLSATKMIQNLQTAQRSVERIMRNEDGQKEDQIGGTSNKVIDITWHIMLQKRCKNSSTILPDNRNK